MKKFYAFAAAALFAVAANAAETLYITGDGEFPNGTTWNATTPDEIPMVDGVYTMEVKGVSAIKISTACGDWDAFNGGAYGCAYGEEPGVAVALEPGYVNNIDMPWKGDYKIVVAGDLSTITLTTDTPKPEVTGPIDLYLKGDMNSWSNDEAWKLEALSENVYKFVCADDQEIAVGVTFKIADETWNKVNIGFEKDDDGNATQDALMQDMDNVVASFTDNGGPANMSCEETFNGVLYLILDLEGNTYVYLNNDKEAMPEWAAEGSVANVAVANGEAQYFTLQGVRVANPSNGLYIVVKDNKAVKTIIK